VTYQEDALPPVTLASGTGAPPSPVAVFDPTLLPNDSYAITISATASGGGTETLTTTVAVFGNLKLGRYVTTYQDLSVPVNGFQMQVRRTYDSIDKHVGDFGVGWHVSLANFRVTANRQLGAGGWTEYPTQCIFGLCFWGFKTSVPHYVTVTYPDQHQEVFDFTPDRGSALLYFQGTARFTARPGTGTTSTLEALDKGLANGFDGNLYGTGGFYNSGRAQMGLACEVDRVPATASHLATELLRIDVKTHRDPQGGTRRIALRRTLPPRKAGTPQHSWLLNRSPCRSSDSRI